MKKGAVVTSITQGKDEVTAKAILGGVGQKRPAEAMFSKPNRDVEGPPTDALQKRVRAPENTGNATKPQAAVKRARRAIVEQSSSEEEIELESEWSESSEFDENDLL